MANMCSVGSVVLIAAMVNRTFRSSMEVASWFQRHFFYLMLLKCGGEILRGES